MRSQLIEKQHPTVPSPTIGVDMLAPPERSLISFYERMLSHSFFSAGDTASAAIHAGFWDGRTRGHREALYRTNQVLASRIGVRPGERVFDAGCGLGASAVWLARELGAEVVGVDLSPGHVYRARRLAHREGVLGSAVFERQDFTATSFPDESFDVVWAVESVCHTGDKSRFLTEAHRLLKPGGRLIVADLFRCARSLTPEEEELLGRWLRGWALPNLATGAEFSGAARDVGFEESSFEDATAEVWPFFRRLWRRSLLGYPAVRALRGLGICDEEKLAAVRSGILQFEALGRGLWFYGIFTATKSRPPNFTVRKENDHEYMESHRQPEINEPRACMGNSAGNLVSQSA